MGCCQTVMVMGLMKSLSVDIRMCDVGCVQLHQHHQNYCHNAQVGPATVIMPDQSRFMLLQLPARNSRQQSEKAMAKIPDTSWTSLPSFVLPERVTSPDTP